MDRLILEGFIVAALSVLAAAGGAIADTASSIAQKVLVVASQMAMVMLEVVKQMTELIYSAVDANEENTSLRGLNESNRTEDDEENEGTGVEEQARKRDKALAQEMDDLKHDGINSAGRSSVGFKSSYVDQSKKVEMKRKNTRNV